MKKQLDQGSGNKRDASGANLSTVRGIAICAGLGGLFLAVYAIMMALKPTGCGGDGCVGRSYREGGPVESIMFLAALGLISAAAIGLFLMHRFDGRGSRVVRRAALAAAASLLIALLGVVIMVVFFQGDSGLLYFLVVFPAGLLGMLAFAVVGAGLMRSRVLPVWSGAMLLLTSVLLLFFNDQNERVLFIIPFGITWMILSTLLWSTAASPTSRSDARTQHA